MEWITCRSRKWGVLGQGHGKGHSSTWGTVRFERGNPPAGSETSPPFILRSRRQRMKWGGKSNGGSVWQYSCFDVFPYRRWISSPPIPFDRKWAKKKIRIATITSVITFRSGRIASSARAPLRRGPDAGMNGRERLAGSWPVVTRLSFSRAHPGGTDGRTNKRMCLLNEGGPRRISQISRFRFMGAKCEIPPDHRGLNWSSTDVASNKGPRKTDKAGRDLPPGAAIHGLIDWLRLRFRGWLHLVRRIGDVSKVLEDRGPRTGPSCASDSAITKTSSALSQQHAAETKSHLLTASAFDGRTWLLKWC